MQHDLETGEYSIPTDVLLRKLGYKNDSFRHWFKLCNKQEITYPWDNNPNPDSRIHWVTVDKAFNFLMSNVRRTRVKVSMDLFETYLKKKGND